MRSQGLSSGAAAPPWPLYAHYPEHSGLAAGHRAGGVTGQVRCADGMPRWEQRVGGHKWASVRWMALSSRFASLARLIPRGAGPRGRRPATPWRPERARPQHSPQLVRRRPGPHPASPPHTAPPLVGAAPQGRPAANRRWGRSLAVSEERCGWAGAPQMPGDARAAAGR